MNKFKSFINRNLDLVFFITVISLKLIIYGAFIGSSFNDFLLVLFPAFISVTALCSISILFNKKHRARILYTLNIIVSSLLVADLIYYGYFKDILCMQVVQNTSQLGSVKSSVLTLIKPVYILFFIDLFIRPHVFFDKEKILDKPMHLRLISFIMVFLISGGLNGLNMYIFAKQQPKLISTMYNRMYIVKTLGHLNFHAIDTYNFAHNTIRKNQKLPENKESEIKSYLANQSVNEDKALLKGAYKGKNLIIIQVEALQGFVINQSIDGNEITPNLNKLITKSLYFDNYFYQIGSGNTSDAEFMTNNSLYPAAQGATCFLYSGNELNSLPKALNNIGYKSAAFHAYKESFWNRNVMNATEGFDKFYGESSFNIDEVVGMGLSDKSFFNQSLEKMKQTPEPYYAFLTTLTSHFPFDDLDSYGEFNVGELEGTFLGNYLKSVHYTDEQIGMFVTKLEEEGIADNSVIAIYGDHYAIPKKEESDVYKLLNIESHNELSWAELQKVPLIIHFPGDKHQEVNHIYSGQMDLYPTIANLYDLPKEHLMGTDLMNAKVGNVILRNSSFTDGNIFYISESNTYYDINSGEVIKENDELKDKKNNVLNQLEYSDAILDHDLLKKFKTDSK